MSRAGLQGVGVSSTALQGVGVSRTGLQGVGVSGTPAPDPLLSLPVCQQQPHHLLHLPGILSAGFSLFHLSTLYTEVEGGRGVMTPRLLPHPQRDVVFNSRVAERQSPRGLRANPPEAIHASILHNQAPHISSQPAHPTHKHDLGRPHNCSGLDELNQASGLGDYCLSVCVCGPEGAMFCPHRSRSNLGYCVAQAGTRPPSRQRGPCSQPEGGGGAPSSQAEGVQLRTGGGGSNSSLVGG